MGGRSSLNSGEKKGSHPNKHTNPSKDRDTERVTEAWKKTKQGRKLQHNSIEIGTRKNGGKKPYQSGDGPKWEREYIRLKKKV